MSESEPRTTILLVEDNPDHAELTTRTLRKGRLANPITRVRDGVEALDYLYRRNAFCGEAGKPLPGLVLLDINLPKRNGFEVLRAMRSDPALRLVPVVMLTTSGQDDEVRRSFELGANSFVTKPVKFEEFCEQMIHIEMCWLVTDSVSTDLPRQRTRADANFGG